MKASLFVYLLFMLVLLGSCSRDLTNPLDADADLNQRPEIVNIEVDATNGIKLQLGLAYSNDAMVLFERKIANTFEPINCQKLTASIWLDNTLNLEQNYNLSYRIRVSKGDFTTEYSEVKTYVYNSSLIYPPTAFTATTIELQGVRLNWQDNSSVETGYKIEKNENGNGYTEIATLEANANTYLHSISGMPANPLNLTYRIKAFNNTLTSLWVENSVTYSGLGAPTNLVITDSTYYHFSIAWTRNSTIATGYEIERKKDGGNFVLVQTVGATAQAYTEQITEIGTFSYRVRAKKDAIYSSYTNEVSTQVSTLLPTEGLVAYYPFNSNTNDESGSGNNSQPMNSPSLTSDRFGQANRAYRFDGINDYMIVPNSPSLLSSYISLCAWVYTDETGSDNRVIVSKYSDNPVGGYSFYMYNGRPEFEARFGEWNFYGFDPNAPVLTNGVWHFVVATYDGNSLRTYSDGIQISQTAKAGAIVTSQIDLAISKNSAYEGYFFYGILDDIRIYNRALSQSEIQALYYEGGWTGKQ